MKMFISRGYKCSGAVALVAFTFVFMVSVQMNSQFVLVDAKSLDQLQDKTCENVKSFFNILNITQKADFNDTGAVCNGHCCNNKTEDELMIKSTSNFERLLRHNTRSLRGILETTAHRFREHVLELSRQSENKTLNLFSQVYRRMSPLSRQPILELYESIQSHISSKDHTDNLETLVNQFFVNLFPVAYHHAVHTKTENVTDDFHIDYKNCLAHTYAELQPFGDIPKQLSKNLVQSVGAATVFLRSLDRAAQVLSSTEDLDTEYLSPKCKTHLLKMSYCPECKGITKDRVKTCSAYCLNVMRGCLMQYVGSLDSPWSSFAGSIQRLMNLVRSKDGIESVVKTLDTRLSEAIMHAMVNGPTLEEKVKRSCGSPSLLPSQKVAVQDDIGKPQQHAPKNKWVSPPDTEMLYFLVTIDKSKDLYSKIVDSLCEDDEFKKDDKNCWTGSHVGEYSQSVVSISVSAQKYNPEVPYENTNSLRVTKLTELSDELVDMQMQIAAAYSSHSSEIEKMQSDMAEGSGWSNDPDDDSDDLFGGSGSGGGGRDHETRLNVGNAPNVVSIPSYGTSGTSANAGGDSSRSGGSGKTTSSAHTIRISKIMLSLPLILGITIIGTVPLTKRL